MSAQGGRNRHDRWCVRDSTRSPSLHHSPAPPQQGLPLLGLYLASVCVVLWLGRKDPAPARAPISMQRGECMEIDCIRREAWRLLRAVAAWASGWDLGNKRAHEGMARVGCQVCHLASASPYFTFIFRGEKKKKESKSSQTKHYGRTSFSWISVGQGVRGDDAGEPWMLQNQHLHHSPCGLPRQNLSVRQTPVGRIPGQAGWSRSLVSLGRRRGQDQAQHRAFCSSQACPSDLPVKLHRAVVC